MKNIKQISYNALVALVIVSFTTVSCQKKFDPKSYMPERTYGGYSTSDQVATSNLILYMPFEGNLVDSVSNTEAQSFGTSFGAGLKGQALSVGLNHYAIFKPTSGIKNLQSFTVTYWVNTSLNSTGIQPIVSFVNPTQFWGNLEMYLDGQKDNVTDLRMHLWGGADGNMEVWLTDWKIQNPWDTWQHVAFSYDMASATFTLYVNGTKIGSSVQDGFDVPGLVNSPDIVLGTIQFMTDPSLTSGADAQPWASYVLGSIDQLRIYNKALSGTDLNALFQLETLGK